MSLLAGQTSIAEALNGQDCSLVSSDGAAASGLGFNQIRLQLEENGMNVNAEQGAGMRAEFNPRSAGVTKPEVQAPDQQGMDYTLQQQAMMTMTNG